MNIYTFTSLGMLFWWDHFLEIQLWNLSMLLLISWYQSPLGPHNNPGHLYSIFPLIVWSCPNVEIKAYSESQATLRNCPSFHLLSGNRVVGSKYSIASQNLNLNADILAVSLFSTLEELLQPRDFSAKRLRQSTT